MGRGATAQAVVLNKIDFNKNIRDFWANVKWGKAGRDSYSAGEEETETAMAAAMRKAQEKRDAENGKASFSTIAEDSEGNELSTGQQEYFRDSQARDEDGRLLKVYHGTPTGGFSVFDRDKLGKRGAFLSSRLGFYFSEDERYARSMSRSSKETAPEVYACYLNIKKPLHVLTTEVWTEEDVSEIEQQLSGGDYDGIIDELGNYVAFYPNQIKLTTNLNLTDDEDVRFSIEDPDAIDTDEKQGYNYQTNREGGAKDSRENNNDKIRRRRTGSDSGERFAQSARDGRIFKTSRAQARFRLYAGGSGQNLYIKDNEGRVIEKELAEKIDGTYVVDGKRNPLAVYHFTPDMSFDTFAKGNVNSAFDLYNKDYMNDLLREGNILYTKNNEDISMLLAQRRQLPKGKQTNVFDARVTQEESSVKSRFSTVSLEDQLRRAERQAAWWKKRVKQKGTLPPQQVYKPLLLRP